MSSPAVNPPGTAAQRSPWLLVVAVMVGTLLIGLDRTVVNLAIPKIDSDFNITVSTAGWLGTAYIISNAVFVPMFGKLGDMIGDRRIFNFGLSGFLVTSVLCGAAPNFGTLVFFRVLQGFVGAAVYPAGLALVVRGFTDPRQQATALGLVTSGLAASIAIGPLVAGPLIDHASWRWIFLINLPICIVGIAMLRGFVAPDRQSARVRAFDYQGSLLLGVALAAGTLGLEQGRDWGWGSAAEIACLLGTVVFAVWFVSYERRAPDPVVDPRMFRNRVLVAALAVTLVTFSGMIGALYLLPSFAQNFLGYSATRTGLLLTPMAIILMVVAPLGARLLGGVPARVRVAGGTAVAALAMWWLSGLDIEMSVTALLLPMILLGFGLALGFAPLTAAATTSVPASETGMASGVLNLTRNIAGAIGIAMFGTLLDNATEANIVDIAGHTEIHHISSAVSSSIPILVVVRAQIDAYGHVFAAASLVMLAGAVVALSLRESRPREPRRVGVTEHAAAVP